MDTDMKHVSLCANYLPLRLLPPHGYQLRTTKACDFTVSIGQESWHGKGLKGGCSQNDSWGSSHWKSCLGLDNHVPNSTLTGLLASGLSASLATGRWPWLPTT